MTQLLHGMYKALGFNSAQERGTERNRGKKDNWETSTFVQLKQICLNSSMWLEAVLFNRIDELQIMKDIDIKCLWGITSIEIFYFSVSNSLH